VAGLIGDDDDTVTARSATAATATTCTATGVWGAANSAHGGVTAGTTATQTTGCNCSGGRNGSCPAAATAVEH
jgi:hypothetical protein